MSQYRIRLAGNDDQRLWDSYVLSQENAGPYHLFSWKLAIEHSYQHKGYYILCEDKKGSVAGIFPLILIKPPLLKGLLVSLPFCDYGGALSSQPQAMEELYRYAIQIAEAKKSRIEVRCKHRHDILKDACGLEEASKKVRMKLDLPGSSDALWNSFRSKLRSQIRRPQKDGLTFTMGSSELLDDFYKVFSINMWSLGSPVHGKSWIESVVNFFAEDSHVGVVYSGSTPVAAGIILSCRDTISIPWASALASFSKSSPNMLLYWGFLRYACDHGFAYFDFGRSTPEEGTYKFKQQWGARPEPLFWYSDDAESSVKTKSSEGGVRKIAEKAWSRLPQVIADRVGPMVRRYISL